MTLNRLSETNHAREELYETLALLNDRLNYAQRFDDYVEQKTAEVKDFKKRKPLIFAATVAGVAATAGIAVYAITRRIVKVFN